MTVYLLESYVTGDQAAEDAATRLRRAAAEPSAPDSATRHLRSTFLPADDICLHLMEARSAEDVRRLARDAGVPCERVVEAAPLP
jgi:hypothetical protein